MRAVWVITCPLLGYFEKSSPTKRARLLVELNDAMQRRRINAGPPPPWRRTLPTSAACREISRFDCSRKNNAGSVRSGIFVRSPVCGNKLMPTSEISTPANPSTEVEFQYGRALSGCLVQLKDLQMEISLVASTCSSIPGDRTKMPDLTEPALFLRLLSNKRFPDKRRLSVAMHAKSSTGPALILRRCIASL